MDFIKEHYIKLIWIEVINLLKKFHFKQLPLVLVFQTFLLHLKMYIWKSSTKLVKTTLGKTCHCAIVSTFDSCSSLGVVKKRNFSKELSFNDFMWLFTSLLSMVFYPHFTLPTGNKEKT